MIPAESAGPGNKRKSHQVTQSRDLAGEEDWHSFFWYRFAVAEVQASDALVAAELWWRGEEGQGMVLRRRLVRSAPAIAATVIVSSVPSMWWLRVFGNEGSSSRGCYYEQKDDGGSKVLRHKMVEKEGADGVVLSSDILN